MATSSKKYRGDRAANRCGEGAKLVDLEVNVETYQLRFYGGKQSLD